jgi:NADH-quinone oxidoreductase subunit M
LIIISAFEANYIYAFLASTTLIISAVYSLWLVKRVIFGEIKVKVEDCIDANLLEKILLFTMAIIVLILGLATTQKKLVLKFTIKKFNLLAF